MPDENQGTITETEEQDVNRTLLIEQARTFLQSPTVSHENENAQKNFLLDKGLTEREINDLFQEMSRKRLPPIPPRTYPQPPPSNLPLYLTLLLRIATWTLGIVGVISLKFLLPRIIRSFIARHQLVLHQYDLMTRLKDQMQTLKDEQCTTFKTLQPTSQTLEEIPVDSQGTPSLSIDAILSIFFQSHPTQFFTVDEIIERLESSFPNWLQAQDKKELEVNFSLPSSFIHTINNHHMKKQTIRHELTTSTSYFEVSEHDPTAWSLSQDLQSNPPPSNPISSLDKLRDTIKTGYRTKNLYQYAFKSLTDFTAFLSRETFQFYTVDTTAFRRNFGDTNLSPIQDEVRREIRALKGLVLNR
ncbi:hypothetical protein Clacol_001735 [Clathrus columnatus]|uniref:Peroxisome membrane anchor protein Pex14p N-terminal domain-containing protein n=1 Tax=Clathrus columnatus TaxID=1419009 RepID=A0AAV5A220_9AGAM|nr:hypothetical protein Clacol_001735 [Clathrus columnatus]